MSKLPAETHLDTDTLTAVIVELEQKLSEHERKNRAPTPEHRAWLKGFSDAMDHVRELRMRGQRRSLHTVK